MNLPNKFGGYVEYIALLKAWLQFLRVPNLIIVALTQYLMRFCVLYLFVSSPIFTELDFLIMVLGTMIVAAGGYIINDIYDYPIDQLNKPDKVFINRLISLKNAWWLYSLTCILVFAVGGYFYYRLGWMAAWTYPIIGIFMLWLYSYRLKKSVLLGNLTVALFCAFVPFMVYVPEATNAFPEYELIRNFGLTNTDPLRDVFYAYAAFAFLSTLLREIIKDIEDQEGDAEYGGRTLPIVFGQKIAKIVADVVGLLFLVFVAYVMYWEWSFGSGIRLAYAIVAITMPLLYVLWKLVRANEKSVFHHLSTVTKGIMVTGLFYLVVFYFTS